MERGVQVDSAAVRPDLTARILLIEDDREVSDALAGMLGQKGYHTVQSFNGREGLITAINQTFDLILLDKMLPELDGLELLQRLRRYRDTPVMILSACGAEQDRIDGFNGGADDYLPKPFNMTELMLRIRALLRRSLAQPATRERPSRFEDEELVLDLQQQRLVSPQAEVELTPIEAELLKTFLSHKGEILSKPYLYQRVLNKPFSRYDRGLDMHVSNLRSKFTAVSALQRIKTIRGQGYCYQ
ncbi:response regulator transcription factor [Neptuniibacter halophilus]|uniref:response regulator transcription factor n=1 Tax=Neptuniibacter halophilus TaxID=651666 RepID=UPI002573AA2A|nr:response regulator transcription factor [Neptuniibacter halophilus]